MLGRFSYIEADLSVCKAVANKAFFSEWQVANSTYFPIVNTLCHLYPGKDKQQFFSKAQWKGKKNFRGDVDSQSALLEWVENST